MDADGGNLVNLTNSPGYDFGPAWSHDGARIAFSQYDDVGLGEVWSMNADGTGQTNLTNESAADDSWPTWSADGARLAFTRFVPPPPPPDFEIWTMNADGSGQFALTANSVYDTTPVWSPDGTKIAFVRSDQTSQIYVMNADGSGEVNLLETTQPCTTRSRRGLRTGPTSPSPGTSAAISERST